MVPPRHLPRRTLLTQLAATAALPWLGCGGVQPSSPSGSPLPAGRPSPAPPSRIPYVDGLCIPSTPEQDALDLPASGLSALLLDVSDGEEITLSDGTKRWFRTFDACSRSITAARRAILRGPLQPVAHLALRGADIDEAERSGRAAVFFQFQGCEPLDERLDRLDVFHELGLRFLQITHNFDNSCGGGCLEREPKGLTPLGRDAVAKMTALGIVPDLAHASDVTAIETLGIARGPVILSHGAARAIVDNPRCAPDPVIRRIAASGGVVGIFMMSMWLTPDPTPTVEHLIRQIRHIIQVGGIDAVGVANDFSIAGNLALARMGNDNAEGAKGYLSWWRGIAERGIPAFERPPQHVVIPELNNVRRFSVIHEALERARFSAAEIEKILGGNWLRVLRTLA
jgi:membrane dipeptidase